MQKIGRYVVPAVMCGLMVGSALGAGTEDPNLTTLRENFEAGFTAVKTVVIGIVGFGLTLALVKWLRRK